MVKEDSIRYSNNKIESLGRIQKMASFALSSLWKGWRICVGVLMGVIKFCISLVEEFKTVLHTRERGL